MVKGTRSRNLIRLALVSLLAATPAFGQTPSDQQPPSEGQGAQSYPAPGYGQPGMGPGMMRGYGSGAGMGPGMMQGYGPGMGMGPGMMQGYGPGMGMGMGPGMMPGCGAGPGFGLPGALRMLDLSDEQLDRIMAVQREQRQERLKQSVEIEDAQAELARLYGADNWDADAISKVYDRIFAAQRQMIRSDIQARNQTWEALTPEQREQLRNAGWARPRRR